MNKRLEDLTKQDWDTLFPIELEEHDPNWKNLFEREKQLIQEKMGHQLMAIEHVGSTAIPGIKAKPYIDISIEIPQAHLFDEDIIRALESLNYHYFQNMVKGPDYMLFVKGYHLNGQKEQVFHIHMCPTGHEMLDQIPFRDYLMANPKWAWEYELLKTELVAQYKNDRSGYRMSKDHFIAETMKRVKEEKGGANSKVK